MVGRRDAGRRAGVGCRSMRAGGVGCKRSACSERSSGRETIRVRPSAQRIASRRVRARGGEGRWRRGAFGLRRRGLRGASRIRAGVIVAVEQRADVHRDGDRARISGASSGACVAGPARARAVADSGERKMVNALKLVNARRALAKPVDIHRRIVDVRRDPKRIRVNGRSR